VTPDTPDDHERLLKAIAHPLRHRILVAIDEAGEASPNLVAQALGEPLGRVAHHVRVLARLGVIELTRTEPRRGATEHYYRAVVKAWFDDEMWADLPRATRRSVIHTTLRRLMEQMAEAAKGTGLDHPQVHVSYVLLDLDDEAMDAVAAVLGEALDRVQAIKEEAARRLGDAPAPVRTELGIVHFERP
jgi:DNA-binding transcriptional ArsR family regulator